MRFRSRLFRDRSEKGLVKVAALVYIRAAMTTTTAPIKGTSQALRASGGVIQQR